MIERRYPIQTVLAERKMFAGGGAVLPQQMMPQQQQMMPPQQSGGILASSGPLLDAVAAGAINPDGDGGASLSDVQGFANGGLSTSQDLPYITRSRFEKQTGGPSLRPDSRFLPESGMTTDISAQLPGATDEQLRQFISSVDPITQGAVLSQAQAELDRRSSLGALNTQPVNSLTPLYDFNDISDNAEDQAEGFSGQDQDPGGMTGPGFSNFSNQDPKTSFTIPGIKESHPARSVTTNAQMAQYRAMKELEALAKGSAAATGDPSQDAVTETAAAVSMGIDSFDPDYMDETTTSITDAMDVGFDDSMGPSAGDPSDPTEDDDEDGAGSEDEGAAAADGGYFTSRMYNANSGQSGYPNMTAAEEIENGVQRFRLGGSIITPQGISVNLNAEDAEAADAARGAMVDFGPVPEATIPESRITPYKTPVDIMAAIQESISLGDQAKAGMTESEIIAQAIKDFPATYGDQTEFTGSRLMAEAFKDSEAAKVKKSEAGSSFDYSKLADEDSLNEEFRDDTIERNSFLTVDGTPVSTADGTPVSAEAGVDGELVGGSQIEVQSDADSSETVVENAATIFENIFSDNENPKSSDKTKSAMATAVEKFKSAMPEYEGMSESEKGYAIMEAGLRIMAGKSSDALTNIAEGLKGLGPKFAKDAKDKRAWNRQIDLSAAKYALSSVEKLRTEEKALAAEGRKRPFEMMTTEPVEIDGVLVPRGTAVPLTNQQITDGYIGKYKLTYRESFMSNAAALAKLAATNAKSLLKPGAFSPDREKYLAASKSFKNGLRMKSLLMEAANIAIPEKGGEILGAVPLFKSWVDKGFNAAGYQNAAEIDTFRSDKPEQYKALVKTIGTTMVTEILNETNKTVSDGDRQRVEELVAAYSDFDGTVASYEVLKMKLSNLEKTIDTGISGAANAMASLETQWKDAKFIGGGTAAETMASIRNFSDRPVSYSFGDRSSKPIPYKDIINMKTRKFTPKYQNIFGKKVPK
jgi:hypothetical protein